jgi:hypothetical protein
VTIVIGIAILVLSVSQMGWRNEDCTVRGVEKLHFAQLFCQTKKKRQKHRSKYSIFITVNIANNL